MSSKKHQVVLTDCAHRVAVPRVVQNVPKVYGCVQLARYRLMRVMHCTNAIDPDGSGIS